jgi:undecaprenyl-diphosphatase
MTLFEAALLGVVQGLTEFLPVSSSGHLVIMQNLLGFANPPLTFDVMVHLGTVLAVITAFWSDIVSIIRRPTQKLVIMIIVGSIPTGIIGILFKPYFEVFFSSLLVVGVGLIITGMLLWFSERFSFGYKTVREMTLIDALVIGTIQGVAIIPGISRSGSTIAGGLLAGLDRELAARFSFLLAIPAILGASLLEARNLLDGSAGLELFPMLVGSIVALVTGYFAVRVVIKFVKQGRLSIFAYYCWALGLLLLAQQMFF